MTSWTTVKWVCASVTGLCGVIVLTAALMMGASAWLFADVPGARNDLLREVALGSLGVAFLAVAAVTAVSAWRTVSRHSQATMATWKATLSIGSALIAGVLAPAGAGRFTAAALAEITGPILEDPSQLNTPDGNGVTMLVIAVVLSLLSYSLSGFDRPAVKRAAVGLSEA